MFTDDRLKQYFIANYDKLCKGAGLQQIIADPVHALMDENATPINLKLLIEVLLTAVNPSGDSDRLLEPKIISREVDNFYIGSLFRKEDTFIKNPKKSSPTEDDIEIYHHQGLDQMQAKISIAIVEFNWDYKQFKEGVKYSIVYINPVH